MQSVIDRGFLSSGFFFNGADASDIVRLTACLPDRWFVETTIDQREPEKPRVWIHPAPSYSHHGMSFGLRKGRRMTFVVVEEHASGYRHLEQPYADVRDAFDGIQRWIQHMAAKRQRS